MSETSPSAERRKRVTIRDVAAHAGVSVPAVSKVIRGANGVSSSMRSRVEAAISALDYRPHASARGMRGKTFTIGVMLSDLANPFFAVLVENMTRVLKTAGYELMIAPAGDSSETQAHSIEALIDRQMDGLILVSPLGAEEYLSSVGSRVPAVVVGRHGPAKHYDTASGDDVSGAGLVVEHFLALGHRSIAFLAHPEEDASDPRLPQNARLEGYRRAMEAAGLGDEIDIVATGWSQEGGRAAAMELIERRVLPTAFFAGPDVSAFAALDEFWAADLAVPSDISVCGYDDTDLSRFAAVGLTTVDQRGADMGAHSAALLLERMNGRMESRHVLTRPVLVPRRTTAAPR
ncbi:LacI family DNA-binding transcriptional regulator [Rathayibacter sp. SD072]|uniref:LacI family DNA-binding transcriptional regulator n=1 Tax=Rathayibacter sp. SD072 TaxID=2781731 RepID=UPI001A971F3C|nr:LacI family DNA-binding transcriptional regulator [Rathayibacter sp. SD072]MBO0982630.1 LacI family DNA-binding transcriptional regulator [Rathayibacter sp. SD072]